MTKTSLRCCMPVFGSLIPSPNGTCLETGQLVPLPVPGASLAEGELLKLTSTLFQQCHGLAVHYALHVCLPKHLEVLATGADDDRGAASEQYSNQVPLLDLLVAVAVDIIRRPPQVPILGRHESPLVRRTV